MFSWDMPIPLSVLGTPVKVDPLVISWLLASFRSVLGAVDRSRGQGGAPAGQRGRTTLRPMRIHRILVAWGNGATHVFKSCVPPVKRMCGERCSLRVPGAQPYLGPRTMVRRHDD